MILFQQLGIPGQFTINVKAQLKYTDFVGEGRGISILQDPSAACFMWCQSMGPAGQWVAYYKPWDGCHRAQLLWAVCTYAKLLGGRLARGSGHHPF